MVLVFLSNTNLIISNKIADSNTNCLHIVHVKTKIDETLGEANFTKMEMWC